MSSNELTIKRTEEGGKLTLSLSGEINSLTAKDLEDEIYALDCDELVFDFAELDYTTSAGIRILLSAKSGMNAKNGEMYVINPNDSVREIFEIVGLYSQFVKEQ